MCVCGSGHGRLFWMGESAAQLGNGQAGQTAVDVSSCTCNLNPSELHVVCPGTLLVMMTASCANTVTLQAAADMVNSIAQS
jgi:hypothetical protein